MSGVGGASRALLYRAKAAKQGRWKTTTHEEGSLEVERMQCGGGGGGLAGVHYQRTVQRLSALQLSASLYWLLRQGHEGQTVTAATAGGCAARVGLNGLSTQSNKCAMVEQPKHRLTDIL